MMCTSYLSCCVLDTPKYCTEYAKLCGPTTQILCGEHKGNECEYFIQDFVK